MESKGIHRRAPRTWRWVAMLSVGLIGCGDGTTDEPLSETSNVEEASLADIAHAAGLLGESLCTPVSGSFLSAEFLSDALGALADADLGSQLGTGGDALGGMDLGSIAGCISLEQKESSIIIVLDQCVVDATYGILLSGRGTATYNEPGLEVSVDGTVYLQGVPVTLGVDLVWSDLEANQVPVISLHGDVSAFGFVASVDATDVTFGQDGYTGTLAFDVGAAGQGVSSSGVVLSGDTESYTINGPVDLNVLGMKAHGEVSNISTQHLQLLPQAGALTTSADVFGWKTTRTTYYGSDTPESGWVLVNVAKARERSNAQPSDTWKCVNLKNLKSHEASKGATCADP